MDSQYSLSHTTTPHNTHTLALTTRTATGDEEEAPAGEGETDGDGVRRTTVIIEQFSRETREIQLETEKSPLKEVRLEETAGNSDAPHCCHVDLAPSSSFSELGFCAVGKDETTPVEDETAVTYRGMADDGLVTVDEGDTMPMEKDPNLDGKDGDLVRRPKLGCGAPSTSNYGERRTGTFNMAEFIQLARVVIDAGDHDSLTALEELKLKWETRFGKQPAANLFPGPAPLTEPPLVRGIRKALRTIIPPAIGVQSNENSIALRDGVFSSGSFIFGDIGGQTEAETANTRVSSRPVTFRPNLQFSGRKVTQIHDDAAADVIADSADDVIVADTGHDISNRKTLSYIAPTMQNGEVVVYLSLDTVRDGAKGWETTVVGYFLGKRPYYHHLKEFAFSVWPALREVTATTNGFFFFRFKSVIDMEEVIEGGPWLFQGQPIVLQKWEPGMAMRKLKHTQVPVWIKMRHLPMEFWTTKGLSTVASGVGKPLYPDAITRACTRLDFARVCVMIDVTQTLRKHIIIMTPDEDGGETPCKVDVEYEWLPPKCTDYMTLGHSAKECTLTKPQKQKKPPVKVYVPKVNTPPPTKPEKRQLNQETVVEVEEVTR
ncbi:UNVERIFIED_CONTAM: hypothetical protein Sindi_0079400 [Sesamum indicum]